MARLWKDILTLSGFVEDEMRKSLLHVRAVSMYAQGRPFCGCEITRVGVESDILEVKKG